VSAEIAKSRPALLRLFGSGVVDQALLSAASFAVGLILIRYSSSADYGQYVLIQAAVLFLVTLQSAWVLGPATVLSAKAVPAVQADMLGSLGAGLARLRQWALALWLAGLAAAGALGWLPLATAALLMAAGLAGAMALRREYLRGVLMIHGRAETMLRADGLFVLLLLAAVAAAVLLPGPVAGWASAGFALASLAGAWHAGRALDRAGALTRQDRQPYWQQIRPLATWATVGAAIYWVLGQGYNYVLALKLDATAVASVNAARLLLMPTYLLTMGVKSLLLPMCVRWLDEGGFDFVLRQIGKFVLAIALLDLIYFAVLMATHEWLVAKVLRKTLADQGFMLSMWFLLSLINLVRDLYLSALLARERFRDTAGLVALTAALTLLTMWPAIGRLGMSGALVGLAVGETVFLLGALRLIARERRRLP
jgi:O-antigen/teichoic acid export membrane protein